VLLPLRYLPHMHNPDVLQMGLSPLPPNCWIEPDLDLPAFHAHKTQQRRLLGSRVYCAQPESVAAQQELATLLFEHLLQDHPEFYAVEGDTLQCAAGAFTVTRSPEEPLWTASLSVADDLLLLERRGADYVLTAASLCSPSHWKLEDKLNQPMAAIHGVVPGLDQSLQARVQRFFWHLRPGQVVARHNWGLQRGAALCVRESGEDSGELHYRSERQTLRRLPLSGAIVFTIRVYLHPLAALAQIPQALPHLFSAIDSCPPRLAVYKGFDRLQAALAVFRGRDD
jgi:dimethylamine monooxygenase subunit A